MSDEEEMRACFNLYEMARTGLGMDLDMNSFILGWQLSARVREADEAGIEIFAVEVKNQESPFKNQEPKIENGQSMN